MATIYTPTKGSRWTELNKERCRRMERIGLMTDAGRAVMPDMSEAGFRIDEEVLAVLQADPIVWTNFCAFPPLYQRVRIDNVQHFKKINPDLYRSRLDKLVSNTRKGILFGDWNDGGRLGE